MIFDIYVFRPVSVFGCLEHQLPWIQLPPASCSEATFKWRFVCVRRAKGTKADCCYVACKCAVPLRRWLCPPGRNSCWGRGCTGCDTCTSDSGRCYWRMTDTCREKVTLHLILQYFSWPILIYMIETKKERKSMWRLFLKGCVIKTSSYIHDW